MKNSSFFTSVRILFALGLLVALATGARAQGVTNIPVVTVQVPDASASEAGDPGLFRLFRDGPTNASLYLFYTLGGTASNGVDYAAMQYVTSIPAGQRTVDIPIVPIPDNLVEGPETVELQLIYSPTMPPINYTIGTHSNGVVYIADNVPTTTNHPPSVAIISPTNNSAFSAPANIYLFATAHDPDAGDSVSGVEFFAGTTDLGPGVLLVLDPPGVNGVTGPVYVLNWTNVPPGVYELHARATDTHSANGYSAGVNISVLGNQPPAVSVTATDPQAMEPGSSNAPNNGVFRISRTGGTSNDLTVTFAIGGTASNGVDYVTISNTIVIPVGQLAVELPIVPLPDTLVENYETVVLHIVAPVCPTVNPPPGCYVAGQPAEAAVYIYDNYLPPPPTNHPPSVGIYTPTNNATFSAPANIPIGAQASDPDATDYVATVEFFAVTNSLGIITNNPLSVPPANPFQITWSNVPPGIYYLRAKATDSHGASSFSDYRRVVVAGPEQPSVTVQASDPQATEPGAGAVNPGVFRFVRSGPTNDDLTVVYSIHGSASNGVDYATISNSVFIPAGQAVAELVITPLADALAEGVETVELSLETQACIAIFPPPPGCYLVGNAHAAAVYIYDGNTLPTNRPPSVGIITPVNNASFAAPANIFIAAGAYDQDAGDYVATVEFFEGTNSLGIVTNNPLVVSPTNPFQLTWTNVPPGEYFLRAKATDSHGASSLSEPRRVLVGVTPQPVVTIQASDSQAIEPALGAINPGVFRISRTGPTNEDLTVFLSIHGSASNGVDYATIPGAVVIPAGHLAVELVINPLADTLSEGVETVELGLEPLACIAIFPPPPGCYLVGNPHAAVVYISDGSVPPGTNHPPVAYLVSPHNGAVFVSPVDITLIAEAADYDGQVTNVEFFAGDHLLGNDSTGVSNHYSIVWSNVVPGIYNLRAKATDDDGAMGVSYPVSITVLSTNRPPETNHPPVVTITARDGLAVEGTNYWPWLSPSNTIPVGIYPDGTNTATFVVRRDGPTNAALEVLYSIGGTASNGVDYLTIPGTVTIPAGHRYALIVISPVDDDIPECAETVILNVKPNPGTTNYGIGWPERAGAIILDNDTPPPGTQLLCDGTFQIGTTAFSGAGYRIEATTDMRNWIPVCTNPVTDGGIYFTDPETSDSNARFYRVVPLDLAPVE